MIFKEIKNNQDDLLLLKKFINNLGELSLKHFRYFNKRKLNIIEQHLLTVILIDEECEPVCYGHLDIEKDVIWLGICVSDYKVGLGYGSLVMEYIIEHSKNNNVKEVSLTVDVDNLLALELFKKFGFKIMEKTKSYYIMKKYINI